MCMRKSKSTEGDSMRREVKNETTGVKDCPVDSCMIWDFILHEMHWAVTS